MLLDCSLVNEQADGAVGIANDLSAFLGLSGCSERRMSHIDGELHEPLDTDILLS